MWIVKMDGDFQALFALESDAWRFRAERLALFPDREITVYYAHADSALLNAVEA